MTTKVASAPQLTGNSPWERSHLTQMLTGVTDGYWDYFAGPYLLAFSSLETRSRGPCLPALCLLFTPPGKESILWQHWAARPSDLFFPSRQLPPACTNSVSPRTTTSFSPLVLANLCSVEERAGLFPPSSHENTHPFLPGRKIAVTSITQSHYYSLGGSNGRNIRPYIPPALRCPKTGLKTWVSGSLSSPCTVCGKLKGEKKIPRL